MREHTEKRIDLARWVLVAIGMTRVLRLMLIEKMAVVDPQALNTAHASSHTSQLLISHFITHTLESRLSDCEESWP